MGCVSYNNAYIYDYCYCCYTCFAVCANRAIKNADPNKVPGPFLNVVELIVESLDGMVKGTMGPKKAMAFRNYVSALFLFILACNLSGLLGLRRQQQILV